MPRQLRRIWLIPMLLLMVTSLMPQGNALEPYARCYPSQGTVYTNVLLEVRIEYNQWVAYVYLDENYVLAEKLSINFQSPPVYGIDFHFNIPNAYPYSEHGLHNITVEMWSTEPFGGMRTLNCTFEIIEYYPPTSEWWRWWGSVPDSIKANLTGPQGPQGIQGPEGEIGPQGAEGVQGLIGEKGDAGPYPLEATALNLSLSAVSLIASIAAVGMFYKMKKSVKK